MSAYESFHCITHFKTHYSSSHLHCILQDRLDGDIHSHSRTPKAYSNDEERKEAFVGKIREALNLMRNQLFEVCLVSLEPKMLLLFFAGFWHPRTPTYREEYFAVVGKILIFKYTAHKGLPKSMQRIAERSLRVE